MPVLKVMFRPRLNTLSVCITMFLALVVESGYAYSWNPLTLSQELKDKLEAKSFLPTTEFFVATEWLYQQGMIKESDLLNLPEVKRLDSCGPLPAGLSSENLSCFTSQEIDFLDPSSFRQVRLMVEKITEAEYLIRQIFDLNLNQSVPAWARQPRLLAQTIGNQPIMQIKKSLAEIPTACLQAVLAIEDTAFLDHSGVSITGTLRALTKNLTSGRKAQGGSTITQQLVKNYFLTSERTYKRKFQEIVLAVLLESQFTKDQILETYLNIIYMAQNGPYQVVGYPAASEFYFQKPIEKLKVAECALLGAILNGPGVYNPFKNPDKALSRRNRVLDKMKEQGFLSESQHALALNEPLPAHAPQLATETSPYFLEAARNELLQLQISPENKKILLTLDIKAQSEAQKALQDHLNNLESQHPVIKKLKAEKNKRLEGLILTVDNYGRSLTAIGGRSFRQSQFNRITQSRRQVGSLIKPFVYLAAMEKLELTPESLVLDEKWQVKIHQQTWAPANYDKKTSGAVPLYYALKMSLNIPVAKLLHEIGPETLIEYLQVLGVKSPLQPHLSLSLGTAELTPIEMTQAYLALAQFGTFKEISFIDGLWFSNNQPVKIESQHNSNSILNPRKSASILSMLKQTLISGTAQSVSNKLEISAFAGKTGTTSDNRDAWFVAMSPFETTLTWVGYDDNTSSSLTGASGALPIWNQYISSLESRWPKADFLWPEGTEIRSPQIDKLRDEGVTVPLNENSPLVFDIRK
jgi:penicillin-binding protein 1B